MCSVYSNSLAIFIIAGYVAKLIKDIFVAILQTAVIIGNDKGTSVVLG